jgi:hypothetical protein
VLCRGSERLRRDLDLGLAGLAAGGASVEMVVGDAAIIGVVEVAVEIARVKGEK